MNTTQARKKFIRYYIANGLMMPITKKDVRLVTKGRIRGRQLGRELRKTRQLVKSLRYFAAYGGSSQITPHFYKQH